MEVDYLVVGSGLTGSVIARSVVDAGREVLVLERRAHAGGNVHDHPHPSGIRVHTYGPHYFRTSSDRIWDFVNRFASFEPYEASLQTLVAGQFEPWPPNASAMARLVGSSWHPEFQGQPDNFEEACLAKLPRAIYEHFIKGYTEKQWGVPARTLSAELANRIQLRNDDDTRLMRHKHQGLPSRGYTAFIARMLEGIPLLMQCDYVRNRDRVRPRVLLVFTGPIDEFFDHDLGRLVYRGQRREHEYLPDQTYYQPCAQVNNPDPANGAHVRTLEWKHMMPRRYAERIMGTVITRETPYTPEDPEAYEYPFPDARNAELYRRYRERAEQMSGTLICGRLGEYRYYDMDQAIGRALVLAERILAT